MMQIALGSLSAAEESAWMVLEGGALMPGLLGAQYEIKVGPAETVREVMHLGLRGSLDELRQVICRLEALLRGLPTEISDDDWPVMEQSEPVYLRLWSDQDQRYYYSPLLAARIENLPGHLEAHQRGSFGLDLILTRRGWFESEGLALPLSNSAAIARTDGLALYNHDDDTLGHDNWFSVETAGLDLEHPASVRLEISNTSPTGGLGDFWVGALSIQEGFMPGLCLQAEEGSGGTSLASVQASGGLYSQYGWSGSGWQTLSSWSLSYLELAQLASKPLLPILRFFSLPGESHLRVRLLISSIAGEGWNTPAQTLLSGQSYCALSPLRLPLAALPGESYPAAHTLSLQAAHPDSGSHLLELDDLLLLPQDAFAFYQSISGLSSGAKLVDDGFLEQSWSVVSNRELCTHHKCGDVLELLPGMEQRFYVFQSDGIGMAPIDRTLSVRAWYRLRRRIP